jgi:hopanoid biosynthesis associated radical SAM protein HpnH
MWTVARYVLANRLLRRERFPLVLMLEPLLRCNLSCAGCGKIQHPVEVLRRQLSPEECFRAAEECGAPIVSIPGGEPLLHPQIDQIVSGLVERKKYVYLCTNALLLEESLHKFRPSKYLTFSIHLDGPREEHDHAVCRSGVYDVAIDAIRVALSSGFRVTVNTTLFTGANADRFREFFDEMTDLGIEGITISPGYQYEKAPDQDHFLRRLETINLFRRLLAGAKRRWKFNQSPLFLEFLQGRWDLECTPWGNPTYNVFGWQRPCYLVDEGYADTFAELLEETDWHNYGHASDNPKCRDCLVHSGHEPTAVTQTFGSLKAMLTTARLMLLGPKRETPPEVLPEPRRAPKEVFEIAESWPSAEDAEQVADATLTSVSGD